MSVRRVSDLPDLSSYYPDAKLEDCLMEVSYASPEGQSRRYQSFYQSLKELSSKLDFATHAEVTNVSNYISVNIDPKLGNFLPISSTLSSGYPQDMVTSSDLFPNAETIINYIESLNYVNLDQLSGLYINDLNDLVNMLQSLLNSDDIVLFVAQGGVRYDDVFKTVDGKKTINYNVQMIDMQTLNGTPAGTFKTVTWKESTGSGAFENDIIFFKTLDDAFRMSTQFKFLNNAKLYIRICSDLIWPINVRYSTVPGGIQLVQSAQRSCDFGHSDNCTVLIGGTKIDKDNGISIRFDNEDKISSYVVKYNDCMRTIFFDKHSFYNSRFTGAIKIRNEVLYYRMMFDCGHVNSYYSNITYDNYTINQWNSSNTASFNTCAFLFADTAIQGANINTYEVSFSNCLHGISIFGGNRSAIDGVVEMLSCRGSAVTSQELGSMIRNIGSHGYVYIQTLDNSISPQFGCPWSGSIAQPFFYDSLTPDISASAFMSADVNGNNIEILPTSIGTSQLTSNPNCCVNPNVNSLVIYQGDTHYGWPGSVSAFNNFVVSQNIPHTDTYSSYGYTDEGFVRMTIYEKQQRVNCSTNVFNNYLSGRYDMINGRLRKMLIHANSYVGTRMATIWDYDKYQRYCNVQHYISTSLSVDRFKVSYTGGTMNGESHFMLNEPKNITSTDYSLASIISNLSATSEAFTRLSSTASDYLAYSFTKA